MWNRDNRGGYGRGGGGGAGGGSRERSMMSQAEMILKKKREIEAKMAEGDNKKDAKNTNTSRRPPSMSVSKRWGLKGKKESDDSDRNRYRDRSDNRNDSRSRNDQPHSSRNDPHQHSSRSRDDQHHSSRDSRGSFQQQQQQQQQYELQMEAQKQMQSQQQQQEEQHQQHQLLQQQQQHQQTMPVPPPPSGVLPGTEQQHIMMMQMGQPPLHGQPQPPMHQLMPGPPHEYGPPPPGLQMSLAHGLPPRYDVPPQSQTGPPMGPPGPSLGPMGHLGPPGPPPGLPQPGLNPNPQFAALVQPPPPPPPITVHSTAGGMPQHFQPPGGPPQPMMSQLPPLLPPSSQPNIFTTMESSMPPGMGGPPVPLMAVSQGMIHQPPPHPITSMAPVSSAHYPPQQIFFSQPEPMTSQPTFITSQPGGAGLLPPPGLGAPIPPMISTAHIPLTGAPPPMVTVSAPSYAPPSASNPYQMHNQQRLSSSFDGPNNDRDTRDRPEDRDSRRRGGDTDRDRDNRGRRDSGGRNNNRRDDRDGYNNKRREDDSGRRNDFDGPRRYEDRNRGENRRNDNNRRGDNNAGGSRADNSRQTDATPPMDRSAPASSQPGQMQQGPDKKDPTWWKDALAKAKNIATSLSKEGPNDSTSEYLKVLNQSSQGNPINQPPSSNQPRGYTNLKPLNSEQGVQEYRGQQGGQDQDFRGNMNNRSQEQSRRFDDNKRVGNNGDNFSRNNRDNYSSRDRDNRDRRGGGGGGRDRQRSRSRSRDRSRRDESDSKQEQPRDIDMRQEKSDSYSPTRPDYKPTIKKGAQLYSGPVVDTSEPLPTVIEELANMVAVSGEELEDIARERNKDTPELRFLFERTGTMYKRYRARITEIKNSLDVNNDSAPVQGSRSRDGPSNERKSRWGNNSSNNCQQQMPGPSMSVPPPSLLGPGPANIGPPGMAMPTQLGPPGVATPSHLGPPGMMAPVSLGPPGVVNPSILGGPPPNQCPPQLGPPGMPPVPLGPPGIAVPTHLGPPGGVVSTPSFQLGPPGVVAPTQLGAPGLSLPTSLGSMVSQVPVSSRDPGLVSYATKVFGTSSLTDAQWKQAEDQLKMSVMYGQMAAKQAAAKIMAQAAAAKNVGNKNKYEYDSDEETEGGTWEHRQRKLEMEKTAREAAQATQMMEAGRHHIGDFLPPEELNKFMNKYKAMQGGQPMDNSEYQENKLTQSNIGFKMMQKMGWNEGAGLGSSGTGITAPIGKSGNQVAGAGLGAANPSQADEDDDEFESYRKRMMLAYRFRPNPLNNPRRQYY